MNNRLIALGAAVVLIVVVGIFLLFRGDGAIKTKLYTVGGAPSNIQHPFLKDSNTVYFFTGQAFASYNLSTGKTAVLSPQFSLPTVDTMQWSKDGVLFKAAGYSSVDDLYGRLTSDNYETEQSYWWFYSIRDQSIKLVNDFTRGNSIDDARLGSDGETMYFTSSSPALLQIKEPEDTGESHKHANTLYSSKGGIIKQLTGHDNRVGNIIGTTDRAVYYQDSETPGKIIKVETATKQGSAVISNYLKGGQISPDGNYISYIAGETVNEGVYEMDHHLDGDLTVVSLKDNSKLYTSKHYEGITTFDANSNIYLWYQEDSKDTYKRVNLLTKDVLRYTSPNLQQLSAKYLIAINPEENQFAITTSNNKWVQFSDQDSGLIDTAQKEYQLQGSDINRDGYSIVYLSEKEQYSIYILKAPYKQTQQQVLSYIRSQGVDPNQIKIKWYSGDGVDRTK